MKLTKINSDDTLQTALQQEKTIKEGMYEIELIIEIKGFQHEFRNSTRRNTSEMNKIGQTQNTFPRLSAPPNKNEGIKNSNPQVLDVENSPIKDTFSTSCHKSEPSMGQEPLREVQKLKGWPHLSGKREYDHMEFIRGIETIKEDFELPERLVTSRFNILFTNSPHRWYIRLTLSH
ncbi:hypothetical protein O181_017508 [Austropuccinia psidii MF-1]|uniref:Uncharacterized protein n=1 Tax=Austropuccinia psidii MF-1 TaxID=1389203 RepID=A0A9Q3C791_9BASI|nr:hypothetical protein [Austropuccinia psidii MF-1]